MCRVERIPAREIFRGGMCLDARLVFLTGEIFVLVRIPCTECLGEIGRLVTRHAGGARGLVGRMGRAPDQERNGSRHDQRSHTSSWSLTLSWKSNSGITRRTSRLINVASTHSVPQANDRSWRHPTKKGCPPGSPRFERILALGYDGKDYSMPPSESEVPEVLASAGSDWPTASSNSLCEIPLSGSALLALTSSQLGYWVGSASALTPASYSSRVSEPS